ncbi:hypothetical protein T5B8_17151 [Salinisphaera sp. T5B8]|uniref:EpsG family protein n=1 Tax=unclassified Salinisphaera TaxID=2649847 RepID=UPI0033426C5E
MIAYWIVYFSAVLLALTRLRVSQLGWALIGAALACFVGLRYQVGADWYRYLFYLENVNGLPFYRALELKDPGYQALNWVSALLGLDVWFVNLVAAGVFVYGLIRFVQLLPDPRIALAVSIPYMITVMAMGYTRQAMAFGFVLWGLTYLIRRRLVRFVVLLAIGATIHKSAVILVPLAVLANTKDRTWSIVWVGATGLILFALLLQEHVDALYQQYVISDYAEAAQGGPIRAMMNALPAATFILFRKRFVMRPEERALWFWVSVLCLACVPLLAVSATAVDRVALYLMPIQLVVASYLPEFFSRKDRILPRIGLLGLYGAVMFVWLNYAGHSDAWLPYQFWPTA